MCLSKCLEKMMFRQSCSACGAEFECSGKCDLLQGVLTSSCLFNFLSFLPFKGVVDYDFTFLT